MTIRIDGTNTAANPGITGTDTDTGLQFGTDEVNIVTGGSTRATVDSSGRVGIGTSSPDSILDLEGAAPTITLNDTNGTDDRATLQSTGGALILTARDGTADGEIIFKKFDGTTTDETARITNTGNLQFNSGYGSVATAYGVRAWVNFNGRNTLSIYDDGGISSITDNGTGDYTVNFDFTMPDINYAFTGSASYCAAATSAVHTVELRTNTARSTSKTTTAIRHDVVYSDGSQNRTRFDYDEISIVYFR